MAFEIRAVSKQWERPLKAFFDALRSSENHYFTPHPFTDEYAQWLADYSGKDLYYLMVSGDCVLAYGMLRGWDDGFEVPSLGILVHPQSRGKGLGELMMRFLHCAARLKGARRIRLRVHEENTAARNLYISLGYCFDFPREEGKLVGILEL